MPAAANSSIAFTVGLSHSYSDGGSTVPYDVVYVNNGDGWNTEDYHFYPPAKGLYFFTITIGTKERALVSMMINNEAVFRVECDPYNNMGSSTAYGGDAIAVVLKLEWLDRVSVFLEPGRILIDDVSITYNAFSGFLYATLQNSCTHQWKLELL